jgi:hypothetical protein
LSILQWFFLCLKLWFLWQSECRNLFIQG